MSTKAVNYRGSQVHAIIYFFSQTVGDVLFNACLNMS